MGIVILIIIVAVTLFILVKAIKDILSPSAEGYDQRQQQLADRLYGVPGAPDSVITKEALFQSDIVGNATIRGAIMSGEYKGPWPELRDDGGWLSIFDNLRILKIAGINHRKNIASYVGRLDVALVPEPENEFDPNAIKIIAEDRHHLGYIPSDQTDLVRSMTANEFPYRCTAIIEQCEDEYDGHKFFVGFVYIKRLD